MKSKVTRVKRVIAAKLEKGEKVLESIIQLARDHSIKTGLVNAIGAVNPAEIKYFEVDKKEYKSIVLEEDLELVAANGSISRLEEDPVVHLHFAVGREDGTVLGGHLGPQTTVSIMVEVMIYETEDAVFRAMDPAFNLNVWDPDL